MIFKPFFTVNKLQLKSTVTYAYTFSITKHNTPNSCNFGKLDECRNKINFL